jgi:metal-sulfur cluster biosynthetic enzyme
MLCAMDDSRYDYEGPADLREALGAALGRVIDPEMALSIVDIGLVQRVAFDEGGRSLRVTLTPTSAACPATEALVDEVHAELAPLLPAHVELAVDVVLEPPWTPERMSAQARRFMGW